MSVGPLYRRAAGRREIPNESRGSAQDFTCPTLPLLGNTLLRIAITRNLVSFPAQICSFMRRVPGDLQERIVQLYFVRGWSVRAICERYGLSKAMAHKLIAEWRVRAVESGCIQEIEPGTLDALVQEASQERSPGVVSVHGKTPIDRIAAAAGPESEHIFAARIPIPPIDHPATLSVGRGA
jgi:transposase-like protein